MTDLRVTQDVAEIVWKDAPPTLRVTQNGAEIVWNDASPPLRITQDTVEMVWAEGVAATGLPRKMYHYMHH